MKGKREENILALMALILCSKDCFGERKGVPNVQVAIRVGCVGKMNRMVIINGGAEIKKKNTA